MDRATAGECATVLHPQEKRLDPAVHHLRDGDRQSDWLASRHGTDSAETITLDLQKLTKNTHFVEATAGQPHGYVRSGVPVGLITASGLYGAYDPAAKDGREVLAGLVYAEAPFTPGTTKVPAALFWHGTVNAAKIPGGIDLAKIAPTPAGAQIRFLGAVSA